MVRFCIYVMCVLAILSFMYYERPLSVDVRPKFALGPTGISITVRAERKETNRGLSLLIDGPNYRRSSFDPDFDGMSSPTIRNYIYELRDPGHYIISVELKRAVPDKSLRDYTTFCLAGPDVECH